VLLGAFALALLWQMYRSGPLPGMTTRLVHPCAMACALALLALEAAPGGRRRVPALAAFGSATLFLANFNLLGSGDTAGAALLPYAVLRHGTFSLGPLPLPSPLPYWIGSRDGHLWSEYPVATSIAALPAYLLPALGPGAPGALPEAAKIAASAMSAGSVALVALAAQRTGLAGLRLWLVVVLCGAGSPILSTASQALWQHGLGALGLAAALAVLFDDTARPRTALAGLCAGISAAARPTNAVVAVGLLAGLLVLDRRAAFRFAAGALVPAAAVAVYNACAFGAPWRTGYDLVQAPHFALQLRLFEVLLSPTRGLLPYVPWAIAGAAGLWAARTDRRVAGLAAGAVATLLLYSVWGMWWGGWCYGPRLLADLMPALALGAALLLRRCGRRTLAATAAAGVLSVALHASYVFSPGNAIHRAVRAIDREDQAMEWRRYPPVALVLSAAGRGPGP